MESTRRLLGPHARDIGDPSWRTGAHSHLGGEIHWREGRSGQASKVPAIHPWGLPFLGGSSAPKELCGS